MVTTVRAPADEEFCPEGTSDDAFHCVHWYDGDACCACGAPPMTDEQKREQGMLIDEDGWTDVGAHHVNLKTGKIVERGEEE